MNKRPEAAEEQDVRDLIAGAGPRAAVPPEEVARIKAAVREEWREMVRHERRRRRGLRARGGLALAASVLLALALGWWWMNRAAPVAPSVVASVELIAGSVRTAQAGELAVGGELNAGDSVETGSWADGSPTGAALRLEGGRSLRLAGDTRVRLTSARRVELERGTLYIDSGPAAVGGGVEVVTVLGTVQEIGTQFEVRLSEGGTALRVRVREGRCSLAAGAESHLAARGEQLSLLADGAVLRAGIETYGPEWDWVVATTPSIVVEGRSLAYFLVWVSREMGREVRYAEPALAQAAPGIELHGSTEGFTPEEALEWRLRSSNLGYALEPGTIVITDAR
jgi:hypothetical protein